jgi:ribosome-associated protein
VSATKRQEESAAKDLDSGALAARLAELADSKGATEIVVLDMRKLVSYTDYLAICTARNERQARAVGDEVKLRLKNDEGLLPAGTSGEDGADWIVVDFLDAVLHVFTEEARQRYQLEDLWHEAPRLDPPFLQDDVRRHLYGAAHG